MFSPSPYVPINTGEYVPLADARAVAPADPQEEITVTMVVRSRRPAPELHADRMLAEMLPRDRRHLSREEFESAHGAHPDDLSDVEKFARARGFEIIDGSAARHSVILRGKSGDFAKALRVDLIHFDHERGLHRGIKGPIQVPSELAGAVRAVLGLHNRPCCLRHLPAPAMKKAPRAAFSPNELAELYRFPRRANGKGQCIGVIELGGGYHHRDLERFFASSKLPMPAITEVSVDGAKNAPADEASLADFVASLASAEKSAKHATSGGGNSKSQSATDLLLSTIETTMDVELAAAFAPGAHIVVYFALNTEQGIYHALTTALADKRHRPSVLSLSWGEPEPNFSPKYAALIDEVLKNLANVGVTVCVSSGDAGAHNGSRDGKPSVNFPASSPNALGCGGTTLRASDSEIEDETVWNSVFDGMRGATGGGVSCMFERPFWQQDLEVPHTSAKTGGRGVPDVAGVADPQTGCRIVVGGVDSVSYGTSAVAPLWAALVARLNHAVGANAGHLNSLLYNLAKRSGEGKTFRPITHGQNGVYHAGPGWNACTGLGSPVGDQLLEALEGSKPRQVKHLA